MVTGKDFPLGRGEMRAEAPPGDIAGLRRRIAELEAELAASMRADRWDEKASLRRGVP